MLPWIIVIGTPLLVIVLWWLAFRSAMKDPNLDHGGSQTSNDILGGGGGPWQ
jgi:hypothetical protein